MKKEKEKFNLYSWKSLQKISNEKGFIDWFETKWKQSIENADIEDFIEYLKQKEEKK